MIDAFVRPLSSDEPTVLEEAFALLCQDLPELARSLRWKELREICRKKPLQTVRVLATLLEAGDLTGVVLYVDALPVGLCFWGKEDTDKQPSIACLFIVHELQGHGLEVFLLRACAA